MESKKKMYSSTSPKTYFTERLFDASYAIKQNTLSFLLESLLCSIFHPSICSFLDALSINKYILSPLLAVAGSMGKHTFL